MKCDLLTWHNTKKLLDVTVVDRWIKNKQAKIWYGNTYQTWSMQSIVLPHSINKYYVNQTHIYRYWNVLEKCLKIKNKIEKNLIWFEYSKRRCNLFNFDSIRNVGNIWFLFVKIIRSTDEYFNKLSRSIQIQS